MKNIFKKVSVFMLAAFMAFSMVGCKEDSSGGTSGGNDSGNGSSGSHIADPVKYDPEERRLKLAISALDGTFNPFFTTSATDSQVAGMTQIGMISTDNDGNVAVGENEPTVALDYKITTYNAANQVITSGDVDHTTYEFVIKNGIKFSDGVDLTIKDVLFNLYVYLDPMYSGSSTVYSVDIQGLKAYRENDSSLSDDSQSSGTASFRAAAQQRISNIAAWADDDMEMTDEISSDIAKIQTRFRKDLETDWTSNSGGLESYEDEYSFTEDWQSYYLLEGLISVEYELNATGNYVAKKDANGKYITDLNDSNNDLTKEMEAAKSDEAKIAQYMQENNCNRELAIEYIERDTAIDTVYMAYADDMAIKSGITSILYGMTTGTNILEQFTAEEQSAYFDKQKENGNNVESISGITTKKVTSFDGVNKADLKGEEHDVLCITINGIDPKAIWNFAFSVSPMHYYSNEEAIKNTPFGVQARDKNFFDNVLASNEKNSLPVGAGAYRVSSEKGNVSEDPAQQSGKDFWSSKNVYYQRNDYFYTVGSGISNAKIKYLTYTEVGENNILNRLVTKDIDYGTPGATQANNNEIAKYTDFLGSRQFQTNGYGYVGINPKFVPEINVRRALMKAMDTASIINNYYTGGLAEVIYRPMTKLSWAYPEDATEYYTYDPTGNEIEKLVQDAGYRKGSDGIYAKDGKKLEIKFTIAGETTDHPAYAMFNKAAQLLNQHGFKITVGTDVAALRKLATGNLAVWAAAWTSTVDPDMYQIYHKDSQTTNRRNWDYDEILNPSNSQFVTERGIVNELSTLIDEGRETNNQDERKAIYAEALDKVMELAVELPTYQRNDLCVYNIDVINPLTLNQEQNLKYSSPIERIWEVNYN